MQFEYGQSRTTELIRQTSLKLRDVSYEIETTNVDDALAYFERREDTSKIREKYEDRVATGIRKTEGESGYETYTKQRVAEMIEQGELEIVSVGMGPKIINARATLFTNQTQSWDYVTGEGKEQQRDEDTAKIIAEQRKLGGFNVQLPNADYVAAGVDTGPLHIDWSGGHLVYKAFSPTCIYALFGDSIIDGGVERAVDYTNIEDAAVVVVLLSSQRNANDANPHINQYVAYFGRSDKYENGRRVVYESQNWKDIPEFGIDDKAHDYILKGTKDPANPLSVMAAKKANEGIVVPEYPICLFHGGLSKTADTLVPMSTSLYESCLEIDLAMSKLMKSSLTSALGKDVLTNELGHELPRCLEGAVLLRKGQTLQIMGQPVSNSQGAMEVLKDEMRAIAEGHSVPGYLVIQQAGGNPESGVALVVRTQPLISDRNGRVRTNESEVDRMWNIERYMYEFVTGQPLGNADTRQVWNPGRYNVPETDLDKITRLSMALDKGAMDYVRFIRDYYNFATDQDAMDFIDTMRDEERMAYKAPTATGAQRTGLPLGLSAKLQARPKEDSQQLPGKEEEDEKQRRGPP